MIFTDLEDDLKQARKNKLSEFFQVKTAVYLYSPQQQFIFVFAYCLAYGRARFCGGVCL